MKGSLVWLRLFTSLENICYHKPHEELKVMMTHLDNEARKVQVGCVGDIEASIVGILSFVLQSNVHHHPPPVCLQHPQRSPHLTFTLSVAESTTGLHRMCTELSGRQWGRQALYYLFTRSTRANKVCLAVRSWARWWIYLLSSHQVSHTLQCEVGDAAVVLVTAVPEG